MNKIFILVFLLLVTNVHSQELINFQQAIFCEAKNSSSVMALNIVRVGQSEPAWPYSTEKIMVKLTYLDSFEIQARGYEEIQLDFKNSSSQLYFGNSWIDVEFFSPKFIWRDTQHMHHFSSYLKQNRYGPGQISHLACVSRLTQVSPGSPL